MAEPASRWRLRGRDLGLLAGFALLLPAGFALLERDLQFFADVIAQPPYGVPLVFVQLVVTTEFLLRRPKLHSLWKGLLAFLITWTFASLLLFWMFGLGGDELGQAAYFGVSVGAVAILGAPVLIAYGTWVGHRAEQLRRAGSSHEGGVRA